MKAVFGDNYENVFGGGFNVSLTQITDQIKAGKLRIRELNTEKEVSISLEKTNLEKEAHKIFISEQKFHATNLTTEIEMRCDELILKCDSTKLKNMSDYQILEEHKNMKGMDSEMRKIFERFTTLSKITALCGEEKDKLLEKPIDSREKALKARNDFAKILHTVFTERDISEEKLKNASGLKIELPKFKGYESKNDIYSFKTEFEKLVQPTIQKRYWVDNLKKNYFGRHALTLVEKAETIDEIWTKLINSYGNVKLLLQNKISSLDKLDNLGKVRGDEKLGNAIANIINVMTELSPRWRKNTIWRTNCILGVVVRKY